MKGILFSCAHVFQRDKVGGHENGGKFAAVTEDSRDSNQRIELERILDRLRRNKFSARSLDQIFLAVGDREISIGINVADVAGLEPAIDQAPPSFPRGDSSSL